MKGTNSQLRIIKLYVVASICIPLSIFSKVSGILMRGAIFVFVKLKKWLSVKNEPALWKSRSKRQKKPRKDKLTSRD